MKQRFKNDLEGRLFGELAVLGIADGVSPATGSKLWWCRCSCGVEKKVARIHLVTGNTKTCGHRMTLEEHFHASFDEGPPDACWPWKGPRCLKGYGRLTNNRKVITAHRLAWTLLRGPIPPRIEVCHRCDNPPCVNPDHLFLGTHAENMADMVAKHRSTKPRGSKHHRAILDEETVRAIRVAYASGEKSADLARRFGVSDSLMYTIVRRKSWKTI